MRTALSITVGIAMLLALFLSELPAQEEGAAERIGRRIDRGLAQLTEEVEQAWADVRKRVDELSVQGRVYGRLRWDKALADEPIDVEVIDVDTDEKIKVALTGRVPDEKTRKKAIQLARDTVGVREVVDQLRVEPRRQDKEPTAANQR